MYIYYSITKISKLKYLVLFILFTSYLLPPHLLSCNVPVFRYALERWPADPYRLMIYYQDPLDDALRTAVQDLRKFSFEGDSTLNIIIQVTDLVKTDKTKIQGLTENTSYPLMILLYPESTGIRYPAWYGELSLANLSALRDSPSRRRISEYLLQDGTAVFIFLESGKPDLDQKYFSLLDKEINRLAATLKIPSSSIDINGNPIVIEDYEDIPLKFSVAKISRTDPAEKMFIAMLLGTESDLIDYQSPMVFPVFGQGRSLYALVGAGINPKTLEKSCQSLIEWCSCEIKALHQGVDLLFLTDWSQRSSGTWIKEEMPPLSGLSAFIPPAPKQPEIDSLRPDERMETKILPDRQLSIEGTIKQINLTAPEQSFKENEQAASFSKSTLSLILIISVVVILLSFVILIKARRMHQ